MTRETYTNVKDLIRRDKKSGQFQPASKPASSRSDWLTLACLVIALLVCACIALEYENHLCLGGAPLPTLQEVLK